MKNAENKSKSVYEDATKTFRYSIRTKRMYVLRHGEMLGRKRWEIAEPREVRGKSYVHLIDGKTLRVDNLNVKKMALADVSKTWEYAVKKAMEKPVDPEMIQKGLEERLQRLQAGEFTPIAARLLGMRKSEGLVKPKEEIEERSVWSRDLRPKCLWCGAAAADGSENDCEATACKATRNRPRKIIEAAGDKIKQSEKFRVLW